MFLMASNLLKKEVLQSFKKLHRTSRAIFSDKEALAKVRKEINDQYRKNKNVSDPDSIKELIKLANEIHYELKTSIVELEETGPGRFRLKIRPEMFEEPDPSLLKKNSQ